MLDASVEASWSPSTLQPYVPPETVTCLPSARWYLRSAPTVLSDFARSPDAHCLMASVFRETDRSSPNVIHCAMVLGSTVVTVLPFAVSVCFAATYLLAVSTAFASSVLSEVYFGCTSSDSPRPRSDLPCRIALRTAFVTASASTAVPAFSFTTTNLPCFSSKEAVALCGRVALWFAESTAVFTMAASFSLL